MDDIVFTVKNQIETVKQGFRHVVIIGAGASKACCLRNPEKNNKKIPLMDDLIKIIDFEEELGEIKESDYNKNFELIFSDLYKQKKNLKIIQSIQRKIRCYFSALQLPNVPTIYDYLILSLRKKDLIATFNWDPFLWQAYMRNKHLTDNLPQIAFLHGNVAIGVCEETKTFGPVLNKYYNLETGKQFTPIQLLYPIEQKDYSSSPFIKDQWNLLSHYLKSPSRVTIFGYSAPKTDVDAISIMKKAFGNKDTHPYTQFEIIDTKKEDELCDLWDDFIFSHHFEIHKEYFESTLAKFPRRTGEVFFENYLQAKWPEENYPIETEKFDDFWNWHKKLIENE